MLPRISNTGKFCICLFFFFFFFPKLVTFCLTKPISGSGIRAEPWFGLIMFALLIHEWWLTKTTLLGGKTCFLQATCLCLMSGCACAPHGQGGNSESQSGKPETGSGISRWKWKNLVVWAQGTSLCFFKYHILYAFIPSKGRKRSVAWKAWC